MSETLVEVIYGKHYKYEVVRESGVFSTKYYIRRDGKPFRGPFRSLADAVEAAKEAG
jgi:hypothetical protein